MDQLLQMLSVTTCLFCKRPITGTSLPAKSLFSGYTLHICTNSKCKVQAGREPFVELLRGQHPTGSAVLEQTSQ